MAADMKKEITDGDIEGLIRWTHEADMFKTSPQGRNAGAKLRAVFWLAQYALNETEVSWYEERLQ
jgi:hypothetical protein